MNYRRKDYIVPRSMKEAFGDDDTLEPELRCCSELFSKQNNNKDWLVFVIAIAIVICCIAAFS